MDIPIVNGIYVDPRSGDFRTSLPRNMVPVPKVQGVSKGYLMPAPGIVKMAQGPGKDRSGIRWRDAQYRVSGSKLIRVDADGAITLLGDVGDAESPVCWAIGTDRIAIVSDGRAFYYGTGGFQQLTDPDLKRVNSVTWQGGYFLFNDGTYTIATDLTNPLAINPLRYGATDADPDQSIGLTRLRSEVCVVNRYSTEFLQNVGGQGISTFPFLPVQQAQVLRGAIGPRTFCIYDENIAFMGSGHDESISIYVMENGNSTEIASREVAQLLNNYSEAELSKCIVEQRGSDGQMFLNVHLPDRTLVYDKPASLALDEHTWHVLDSSLTGHSRYRGWGFVWCYGDWWVGDPVTGMIGKLSDSIGDQYGDEVGWDFSPLILYNDGNSAIIHDMELVGLTGRHQLAGARLWTSHSYDGTTWSVERDISMGQPGETTKRLAWIQLGELGNMRFQKIRGTSKGRFSCAKMRMNIEPLNTKKNAQSNG